MKRLKYIITKTKSKDGKTLISNFISLSLLQIAGYVFPLITLPYLSRVIGVKHFGEIAFANTIIIYFQTFVDYGFIFSSVRDIAKHKTDNIEISRIFSTTMYARLILTVISFLFLSILIIHVPFLYDMKKVLFFTFLIVPGHALFADWLFQGIEKMKYITLFNLLIKAIFTACIFIFIKENSDYYLHPLFNALGYFFSGLLSLLIIRKLNIHFIKIPLRNIIYSIKSNTDLFINQLFPNLYNSLSTLFLGIFHGNEANGIFDAGYRFSGTFQQFFNIISRTCFPFLSRKNTKHEIYVKIIIPTSIIASFLLLFFAPSIIHIFYTEEFYNGIYVLQILSISIFFLAVSNTFGTNYLIIKGYEKELRQATMQASLISFILAIPLVYFYSYIGVAIIISFARGLIALLIYIQYRKIQKIESYSKNKKQ